ncbi:MAG: radical SAM protein [Calditrichaceae bacterium]|nr:radical SAM protein [Calditrichaceae bacterium]MBN2709294.1 radical SAM protein [Calditrichaceae bacterium]RQV91990.1 MAG: radical SAM protein [Calditrichota bacterium]
MTLKIANLQSGGLITNYNCTSRCRHCLYACSPRRSKDYITYNQAKENFRKIKSLNCHSVHIGGGEPFLNPAGLEKILEAAADCEMNIDYVETNSSWFRDEGQSVKLLLRLKSKGLHTLLISISPFHNEYIPFNKVKGVMKACVQTGIRVFPWISDFYDEINEFDDCLEHSMHEFTQKFGKDYLTDIPGRYWIHLGGRAVSTYRELYPLQPLEDLLSPGGHCSELTDTTHFHADLYGNYIPGLCSGLSIKLGDIGAELCKADYPLINLLYDEGINSFFNHAVNSFNFKPEQEYLNKCHLCLDIRSFLILEKNYKSHELQPESFYENL